METFINRIKRCIEEKLDMGFRKFVIFPFGDVGMHVKNILRDAYGIEAEYILDSRLWKYNPAIKSPEILDTISRNGLCALLTTIDRDIYEECKNVLQRYFADDAIGELSFLSSRIPPLPTKVGKYSYGPLCTNHPLVESVGAFSSIAGGVDVIDNHPSEYLTTHPMIYAGATYPKFFEYSNFVTESWCLDGVTPHRDKFTPTKRIKIGNDVWLGQNVLITNSANIGNGVIAGAGSIITKDVPDYAVVVGAPARIIRFRYSQEEIAALNKIAWWDWTDDEIRERYDDFYLPINEFIRKYLK